MFVAALASAAIGVFYVWCVWNIVTVGPSLRALWKAGTDAKHRAADAKRRAAEMRREVAVLRVHNDAAEATGVFGDRLIPFIVEMTGEDVGFVCDVLDRVSEEAGR